MKKNLLVLLMMALFGLILAQAAGWPTISNQTNTNQLNLRGSSVFGPSTVAKPIYDGKKSPPLNLGAAYDKAVLKLGTATNQFHCVSATCSAALAHHASAEDPSGSSFGWTFVFVDTNGTPKNVYVYFDKSATVIIRDPNAKGF